MAYYGGIWEDSKWGNDDGEYDMYQQLFNKIDNISTDLSNDTAIREEPEKLESPVSKEKGNNNEENKSNYDIYYGDNYKLKGKFLYDNISPSGENVESKDSYNDVNTFLFFPLYKTSDYSNAIYNWRKQTNPFGTKGFFYFRIFFNFDTGYGLLGGVKKLKLKQDDDKSKSGVNTAYGYLSNLGSIYGNNGKLNDRANALFKFVTGLEYVSNFSPWFFKEIDGLDTIRSSYLTEDDFKEKSINIRCSEESVDMRLGTLFDLYKFSCFDNINHKEVVPKNLRKFDMSIIFMHVPLRNYQTEFPYKSKNEKTELNFAAIDKYGKEMNISERGIDFNHIDNMLSYKMFTFLNCEFDINTLNELQNSFSNETSFDLGKNIIKINYDRVFETRSNEFNNIIFNQDGILYENSNNDRLNNIQKYLKTLKESYGRRIDETNVGENLYGNFTNTRSKYYLDKLKYLKDGTVEGGNIYNYDYERTGKGEFRKNTKYFNKKLDNIKNGTINSPNSNDELTYHLATPNSLKLSWNANAIKNSNNMYAVEGIQTQANTWLGKLAEATWKRTKSSFGF